MVIDFSHLKMRLEVALKEKELYRRWSNGDFEKLTKTQDKLTDTRLFLLISVAINIATVSAIFILMNKACA